MSGIATARVISANASNADLTKPIVALGEHDDPQFGYVIDQLQSDGASLAFVDVQDPCDFSVELSRHGVTQVSYRGVVIEPSRLWMRLKFGYPPRSPDGKIDPYVGVVRNEWHAFAGALSGLFAEICVHSSSMAAPHSKVWQLAVAGAAGFQIPATIVGVGKGAALAFAESHPSLIMKALYASRVEQPDRPELDVLITTPITLDQIAEAASSEFSACPFLLQERLDNSQEHRVIAFGRQIFCYRVVDADGVQPLVDRRMMRPTYRLVETPPGLPALIEGFFSQSGLRYGAFDLLFEKDRIVFFECNPEGQWHSANDLNMPQVIEAFAQWLSHGIVLGNALNSDRAL